MKRVTFFLAFLMVTSLAKAQNYTYDSIVNLDFGFNNCFDIRNFLELRDGSIVSSSIVYVIDDNGQYVGDLGDMLTKLSTDALFLDTTLMQNDYANHCMLERNPQSDGNLFVRISRDFEEQKTDLLIRHFSDDLDYDENSDIIVPLEDNIVLSSEKYLLENEENILVSYCLGSGTNGLPITPVMVRAGLDGTIKDRVELPDTIVGERTSCRNNLMVYNNSPREYAWCQSNYFQPFTFEYYVVDSLFQLKERALIGTEDPEFEFEPGYNMGFSGEQFLPLDDDTYLVSTRYFKKTSTKTNGVRITKYDKTGHTNLCTVKFPTFPQGPNTGLISCAIPADLKKSSDGNLYYVYQTADPLAPSGFYVDVVKLDYDLNVLWHRYCLNPGFNHVPMMIQCLEDGGCVVGGLEGGSLAEHVPESMFYLFFQEDGTGTPEMEQFVRPYAYYPNPAQDELHLQYSPDVTPSQIELFDIQGRMVRLQRNGLERLNLQGLPAGTYTMRVTLEGGKVFSDKVVKE